MGSASFSVLVAIKLSSVFWFWCVVFVSNSDCCYP